MYAPLGIPEKLGIIAFRVSPAISLPALSPPIPNGITADNVVAKPGINNEAPLLSCCKLFAISVAYPKGKNTAPFLAVSIPICFSLCDNGLAKNSAFDIKDCSIVGAISLAKPNPFMPLNAPPLNASTPVPSASPAI